jgi:hypothetical protein
VPIGRGRDDLPTFNGRQNFLENILELLVLQGQVGVHPPQPTILVLQVLEPRHIRAFQSAMLGLPLVPRGRANLVLPPDLVDRAPAIGLAGERDAVGETKPGWSSRLSPLMPLR